MIGKLFKVIFTRRAVRDLNRIQDYHSKEVSATNGRKARKGILGASRKLTKLPASKPVFPGSEDNQPQIRYTKFWSYKIIFTILKKAGEVVILMIRHDKENPDDIRNDL